MKKTQSGHPFSPAVRTGFFFLFLAAILFFITPALAALVLLLFLLLCLIAPFIPCSNFFLPIICRGSRNRNRVVLTFDDGPSPESTPLLLDLLTRHSLQATFFVVGEKAAQYPQLIRQILEQGHTIGNHSLRHDSLLMLRRPAILQEDIEATQQILKKFAICPLIFRPPAGITNPYLAQVLRRTGLFAVNYSCRAFDRGNRNIKHLADKILNRMRPGDIIMLHDLPPHHKEMTPLWLQELEVLFTSLAENSEIIPLEEMIHRPVMLCIDPIDLQDSAQM